MHQHAKFGHKMFGGPKDIVQMFTEILKFSTGLDHSSPFFFQDTFGLWWCALS